MKEQFKPFKRNSCHGTKGIFMRNLIIKLFAIALFLSIGISCNKEDEACIEKKEDDCLCILIYQPVCGCNGKTYGNACVAQCDGITDITMGECE